MNKKECLVCCNNCDENKNYQTFPKNETKCECIYTIHDECLDLLKKEWGTQCPICQKENKDVVIQVRQIVQRTGENQNRSICTLLKCLFYFLVAGLIIGIITTLLVQRDII